MLRLGEWLLGVFNSASTIVHDNNVTTSGSSPSVAFIASIQGLLNSRSDVPVLDGLSLNFKNNTVTFLSGAELYGFENDGGDIHNNCGPSGGSYVQCTGDLSNTNTFWDTSASNLHYVWNQGHSPQSYAAYRSFTGQDAGSGSVNIGSGAKAGCTHVGCTANPVGAGGH